MGPVETETRRIARPYWRPSSATGGWRFSETIAFHTSPRNHPVARVIAPFSLLFPSGYLAGAPLKGDIREIPTPPRLRYIALIVIILLTAVSNQYSFARSILAARKAHRGSRAGRDRQLRRLVRGHAAPGTFNPARAFPPSGPPTPLALRRPPPPPLPPSVLFSALTRPHQPVGPTPAPLPRVTASITRELPVRGVPPSTGAANRQAARRPAPQHDFIPGRVPTRPTRPYAPARLLVEPIKAKPIVREVIPCHYRVQRISERVIKIVKYYPSTFTA